MDYATKTSKGLGYVTFTDPSLAVQAYEGLDKTTFQGRLLHILPAAERNGANPKDSNDEFGKVDVKGEREKQRRETAGKEFNWSMLYMNVRQSHKQEDKLLNITYFIERCSGFIDCRSHEHLESGHS